MVDVHSSVRLGVGLVAGSMHFVGFVLLTVGYFTPVWILPNNNVSNLCYSLGLGVNICYYGYDVISNDVEYVLKVAYIMTTFGLVTVHVITGMLTGAVLFGLHQSSAFMAFLFVLVASLYPVAGVVTVAAAIYVMASYRAGYSTILTLTSGCLILLTYLCLVGYEVYYQKGHGIHRHTSGPKQDKQTRIRKDVTENGYKKTLFGS